MCWAQNPGKGKQLSAFHAPLSVSTHRSLCLAEQPHSHPCVRAACWVSNFAAAGPWKTCFHQAKMYGLLPKWAAAYKHSAVLPDCQAKEPQQASQPGSLQLRECGCGLGGRVAGAGRWLCKEGWINGPCSGEKPRQGEQKGSFSSLEVQSWSLCLGMAAACRGTVQDHLISHSSPSLTASLFIIVWASHSPNF